jgi:hypothetical protein
VPTAQHALYKLQTRILTQRVDTDVEHTHRSVWFVHQQLFNDVPTKKTAPTNYKEILLHGPAITSKVNAVAMACLATAQKQSIEQHTADMVR